MSIDSPYTLLVALAVAVGATGLLALVWDRRGWFGRSALVAAVVLAVTGSAALRLNSLVEAYPSWSALVGDNGGDDDGGGPLPGPRPQTAKGAGHGRLLVVTLPGPASGMTMPMTIYLPAAYDTAEGARLRFPVIEALHGFPGSPDTWIRRLDVAGHLDREIAAGRMAPTVVLMPYQTPKRLLDTECVNLAGGPQAETYLTKDVRAWALANLRVRTDAAGWGLIGYSAGGYCAMNLATKHPDLYAAGASLSGDSEPGIKIGDGSEKTTNSISWRLTHLPPPPVALYVAWSDDEKTGRLGSQLIVRLAKAPMTVTTATVQHGGHSLSVWVKMESPAFDWLSANLARPTVATGGNLPGEVIGGKPVTVPPPVSSGCGHPGPPLPHRPPDPASSAKPKPHAPPRSSAKPKPHAPPKSSVKPPAPSGKPAGTSGKPPASAGNHAQGGCTHPGPPLPIRPGPPLPVQPGPPLPPRPRLSAPAWPLYPIR